MSGKKGTWVIARGSYSDYRVLCACPSKKDAKTLAARFNSTETYEQAGIEWLPEFDGQTERVEILLLSTTLWDDGSETEQRESFRTEWPFDGIYDHKPVNWRWVRAPCHHEKGGRLDVSGTDHERVRRVFSDKRAEIIATDVLRLRREAKS